MVLIIKKIVCVKLQLNLIGGKTAKASDFFVVFPVVCVGDILQGFAICWGLFKRIDGYCAVIYNGAYIVLWRSSFRCFSYYPI